METKLSPYQREAIRNGRTPLPRARGEWPVGVRKRPRCGKSGDPKISRTESPSKCKKSASKTKELIAQPSLGDKGNKQEAEQPVVSVSEACYAARDGKLVHIRSKAELKPKK